MKNALLLTLFVGIAVFGVTQNETNRGYKIKIGDQITNGYFVNYHELNKGLTI